MESREPQEREKESCFGDRSWNCAARKQTICVSLLDARPRREVRISLLFFVAVILEEAAIKNTIFVAAA
jgi:hypothetical protein